jgi:8-oxo-dGTP pyrophosphatase MutT (NUDIX family)
MRKDFVATGLIVSQGEVLLAMHRKLGLWLPIGGHMEAGETPEEALRREIMEEVGLEVEIISKPAFDCPDKNASALLMPHHMQLELIKHDAEEAHQHIDFVFFCRAKKGGERLNLEEHHEMKWFSPKALESGEITPNVRLLAMAAIRAAEGKSQE